MHIGFGSPNFQDTHTAHGAPLGEDEIKLIKKNFGWDPEKTFHVPDGVKAHMAAAGARGAKLQQAWADMFAKYAAEYPELAKELKDAQAKKPPVDIDALLPQFDVSKPLATRQASGKVLDALMPHMPLVLGGSADLTPSNNTRFKDVQTFRRTTPPAATSARCAARNGLDHERHCRHNL